MDDISPIWQELQKNNFKISTDTRKDLSGSIYFALKGENFDGNNFVKEALEKGAVLSVTDNPEKVGENIYLVEDVLKTLQFVANKYRKEFNVPILVIGGSNGKTTSRELIGQVLKSKYKTYVTKENLNNHIGLPLSILQIPKDSEVAVFEIGANHKGEHAKLLNILEPDIVAVTNNGLDHLEGFGSPEGVREANKEIYDWAYENSSLAFVNKNLEDLLEDSSKLERILYPEIQLSYSHGDFLRINFEDVEYATNLVGDFNILNIDLALSVAKYFDIDIHTALEKISELKPFTKRSELLEKDGNTFILDCYNANPSSMKLSLESFANSFQKPKGVILGDMLELGSYSKEEHKKIVDQVKEYDFDRIVFVGPNFKEVLDNSFEYKWFTNSKEAKEWFKKEDFKGFTFLLKGSRGIKIEQIFDM